MSLTLLLQQTHFSSGDWKRRNKGPFVEAKVLMWGQNNNTQTQVVSCVLCAAIMRIFKWSGPELSQKSDAKEMMTLARMSQHSSYRTA